MPLSFDYQLQYRRYRRYINRLVNLSSQPAVSVYTEFSITALAIAFFAWFALRPTATTIASLIGELDRLHQTSNQLSSKIDSLAASQSNYLSIKPQLSLLDQALPAEPQLANFSWQLEVAAAQTRTTIRNLSFDAIPVNPPQKKPSQSSSPNKSQNPTPPGVNFTLTAVGSLASLRDFSAQLTGVRRLASISSFSLRERARESDLYLQIQGQLHYYPTSTNLPPATDLTNDQ
jgi:Tfp pilus assembly protein PilO